MNVEYARNFLSHLGRNVGDFYFVFIPELGSMKGIAPVEELRGSLNDLWPAICNYNEAGYGVFVAVNGIALGKRRKIENVTEIRAVWQDDDKGYDGSFPLPPSLSVSTSPGRYQRYWLLDRSKGELSPEEFRGVMDAMVELYGSDTQARDLSRLLRLPGTYNHKRDIPHLVEIVSPSGGTVPSRYSPSDLVAAFNVIREPKPEVVPSSAPHSDAWEAERLKSALAHVPSEDRGTWLRVGGALFDASGGSPEGKAMWDKWASATKALNYNQREQDRYWNREFSKAKSNPATVATIYDLAFSSGWTGHRGKLEEQRVVYINPDIPLTLTWAAFEELKRMFKAFEGHEPDERQMDTLREIQKVIELMAFGRCEPKLWLSAVPTGMGKTTAVVAAIKVLLVTRGLLKKSVIIFMARLSEIRDFVQRAGLARDQFAVLTGNDDLNDLGTDDPNSARILFTTQQRLERECDYQRKKFSELTAFFYNGKQRDIRIWDEAIDLAEPRCISNGNVYALIGPLQDRGKGDLGDRLADWATSLKGKHTGDIVDVPDFSNGMDRKEFVGLFESQEHRRWAEVLHLMSGRSVRVRQEGHRGVFKLDHEEILPADIFPLLVLDASGTHRETYKFVAKFRNVLNTLISYPKNYSNLPIYYWDHKAGKEVYGNAKLRDIVSSSVAGMLLKENPFGEAVIVGPKKAEKKGLIDEIRKKAPGWIIRFVHYGVHTATNEYRDVKIAIVLGLHEYRDTQYEAMTRGAKKALVTDDVASLELSDVRRGETKHHLLQAANRIAIRKAFGSDCPPGCKLFVMFSSHSTARPREFLNDVLPGAIVHDWEPYEDTLSEKEVRFAQGILEMAEAGMSIVRTRDLLPLCGTKPTLGRYLRNKGVAEYLMQRGLVITHEKWGHYGLVRSST